jgi:hypothetical protein
VRESNFDAALTMTSAKRRAISSSALSGFWTFVGMGSDVGIIQFRFLHVRIIAFAVAYCCGGL